MFGLPLRSASFRCEGAYTRSAERIVVLAQEISREQRVADRARLKRATLPVHYWKLGDGPPVPLEGLMSLSFATSTGFPVLQSIGRAPNWRG